ncbi:MAG: GNAT family N-acetyltransferase [Candidatus Lokiarchaeota archaeon]|nr:GNAT family N-acetyltransferase [Candidatus Lokiarchaeota archaeon]
MDIRFYSDPIVFVSTVKTYLHEHPIENNLIIGILNQIVKDPLTYGPTSPILTEIRNQGKIVLVATRTPPWNTILSYTENLKAVGFLATELMKKDPKTPGILGPKLAVQRFIQTWTESKNIKVELSMNERIYKITEVNPDTLGNHEIIPARYKHKKLVRRWGYAFIQESMPETPQDQIKRSLTRAVKDIKEKRIFLLLDNGKPVSMARDIAMENCGRVNYVYTPPELRRRGYATECVAKLTQKLLDEYDYCVLFTDLSNPTSNSIYQKIGYRPVMDVDLFKFG